MPSKTWPGVMGTDPMQCDTYVAKRHTTRNIYAKIEGYFTLWFVISDPDNSGDYNTHKAIKGYRMKKTTKL